MAYNPFNIFRRNQKALFAVLTVFIMIMFTLQSGVVGGDALETFTRWLGGRGKKGDPLCTIDGKKIYEGELTESRYGLRFQRVMANRYMSMAAAHTVNVLNEMVSEQVNRLSPEGMKLYAPVRQAEGMMMIGLQNPQLAQQFGLDFGAEQQKMRNGLAAMLDSPTLPAEDKEVAREKLAMLTIGQGRTSQDHYFGHAPNRNLPDLIEFMLWQKKADQLGIRLSDDDVRTLVQREFYSYFSAPYQVAVQQQMVKDMQGFTMDNCLKALGEEFRVRLAQAALLGGDVYGARVDKTLHGFPMFNTPYETFKYFEEQCSPTTYGAIPIPVEAFLSRIPEPNENDPAIKAELEKLYQQYKDDEPDPRKETPGFKEPRKIRVGWFSITGTEPYYKQMAEERMKLSTPVAKVGSMLQVPVFGISPSWVAAAVAPTAVPDALLQEEYKKQYSDEHYTRLRNRWDSPFESFQPFGFVIDSSVLRPGNLAAAAGGVGGQVMGFGNPLVAAAALSTGPIAYELRDRVKAGVPAILAAVGTVPGVSWNVFGYPVGQPIPAGWLPGPSLFNSLVGAEVVYRMMTPKPLPIETYRPNLLKDLLARNARELAVGNGQPRELPGPDGKSVPNPASVPGDIGTFMEEVAKLSDNGKAKDMGPVQKYIDEFVARRGLKVTDSQTLRSEWTLEEDPALAPLLAAQRESLREAAGPHMQQQQRPYVPFGMRFFWTTDERTFARNPANGRYRPIPYPTERMLSERDLSEKKPQYTVWRTEEKQAGSRSKTAAWDDVKKAWRWQKAREMAKARAEQIANAIRGSDRTAELTLVPIMNEETAKLKAEVTDPKVQEQIKPFLIRGVCPLTTVGDPTGSKDSLDAVFASTPTGQLQGFQIVPSENIKYPTQDIVNKLIDERTKPPKTAFVFSDSGKEVFYVTTLLKREEKLPLDYQFDVVGMRSTQHGGQLVLGRFQQEAAFKARQSVIGLLKQEFKFEANDEQKKRLEDSTKRGSADEF